MCIRDSYVDDLMMACDPKDEAKLWKALDDKVEFGEQPSDIGKFLGGMRDFKKGKESTLILNTRDFLASAVQRYMDEIGVKQLPHVRTPYLMEDFVAKGKEDAGAQVSQARTS